MGKSLIQAVGNEVFCAVCTFGFSRHPQVRHPRHPLHRRHRRPLRPHRHRAHTRRHPRIALASVGARSRLKRSRSLSSPSGLPSSSLPSPPSASSSAPSASSSAPSARDRRNRRTVGACGSPSQVLPQGVDWLCRHRLRLPLRISRYRLRFLLRLRRRRLPLHPHPHRHRAHAGRPRKCRRKKSPQEE